MKTTQQLLNLQADIETAKANTAQLQGQRKALLKQLSDDYSLKSLEALNTEMDNVTDTLTDLDTKIEENTVKLETEFNV